MSPAPASKREPTPIRSIVADALTPDKAKAAGKEVAEAAGALIKRVTAGPMTIENAAGLQQAVLDREEIGARQKAVTEFFAPLKSAAYTLHRTICGRENEILEPLAKLDAVIKTSMSLYKAKVDKERREQEAREAALRKQEDEARAAQEAAVLESQGEHTLAQAVLEEAIAAPAPVVALKDETAGIATFREVHRWRYSGGPKELEQTPAEVRARTMRLIPREYLVVDESKLTAIAKAAKGTLQIPGVDFYTDQVPIR
jgi:hypothetical protein